MYCLGYDFSAVFPMVISSLPSATLIMQVLRNWSTNLRVGFTPVDKSKKTVNPPQFRYIVVFVGRPKR